MTMTPPPEATPEGAERRARDGTLKPGDPIRWTDVRPDGSEEIRTGAVWSEAPPVRSVGKAWWVLPDDQDRPSAVLVSRASRRHTCGRALSGGAWQNRAGRYIDPGEYYRETDRRARTNEHRTAVAIPRSIGGEPTTVVARTEYDNWLRTIAAIARGE